MLELHVLVHGAFGAVGLVAAGHWALKVTLDFGCSSAMAFSLVVVVHLVLIDLRAPVERAIIVLLGHSIGTDALSDGLYFFHVAHRIGLGPLQAVESLVECTVLLVFSASIAAIHLLASYLLNQVQIYQVLTVRLGLFVFEATDEIVLLLNHLLQSVGEQHVDVVRLAELGVGGCRLVPRQFVVLDQLFYP